MRRSRSRVSTLFLVLKSVTKPMKKKRETAKIRIFLGVRNFEISKPLMPEVDF